MFRIRLYIMCEHDGVRKGLSAIFEAENSFEVIGESGCDLDSIAEAQKFQPDAMLCEVKPGDEVTEMVKLIKDACPYTNVIIFVRNDNIDEARAALVAGADGCLSQTMLPTHLVKVVELTCRTGLLCLPGSLKRLLSEWESMPETTANCSNAGIPGSKCEESINEQRWKFPLTARETEIYKLIVQNYSNKEIGKKLYISQPTVKSHVSSILRKMGLNSRTQIFLREMQKNGIGINFDSKNGTDYKTNNIT